MKLSTLHEARDPKKEAELEPYLTAPFKNQPERATKARRAQSAAHREFGLPDRQFQPNPTFANDPKREVNDSQYFNHHQHHKYHGNEKDDYQKRAGKSIPYLGNARNRPEPNFQTTGTLNKATNYWTKNFNGERWPTLEQAFLNRDWTFKGGVGMYDFARASLFTYLNGLKVQWPEGEKMADTVLASKNGWGYLVGSRYRPASNAIQQYALSRPRNPEFVKSAIGIVGEPELGEFHTDDTFGGGHHYSPQTIAFLQQYIRPPAPNVPDEATDFNKKLKEIEEQPPFAGWA